MKNFNQYNIKIIKSFLLILIIILLYLLFIGQNNGYYCYAYFFVSLALLYPIIKLGSIYSKYLINYVFCIDNDWWKKR